MLHWPIYAVEVNRAIFVLKRTMVVGPIGHVHISNGNYLTTGVNWISAKSTENQSKYSGKKTPSFDWEQNKWNGNIASIDSSRPLIVFEQCSTLPHINKKLGVCAILAQPDKNILLTAINSSTITFADSNQKLYRLWGKNTRRKKKWITNIHKSIFILSVGHCR